ncbi:hypothetical protein GBA52_001494 [Prunus armeniaca]|nr:hypothetical protein GBA52_001494 [Prunus armeniaca]
MCSFSNAFQPQQMSMNLLQDEARSRIEVIAAPQSSTLLHGINLEDHMNSGSGLELDDENNNTTSQNQELGQVMDINLSPWNEFYPTGNELFPPSHPRGGALQEICMSSDQFNPTTIFTPNHLHYDQHQT